MAYIGKFHVIQNYSITVTPLLLTIDKPDGIYQNISFLLLFDLHLGIYPHSARTAHSAMFAKSDPLFL